VVYFDLLSRHSPGRAEEDKYQNNWCVQQDSNHVLPDVWLSTSYLPNVLETLVPPVLIC
jgi:hypothetical protein